MHTHLSFWLALLTVFLGGAAAAAQNPGDTAKALFIDGKYQEGIRLLKSAFGNPTLPSTDRFAAAFALADFYAGKIGDYPRAIQYYRRALTMASTPESSSMRHQVKPELERLAALETTHRELTSAIRRMRATSFQRAMVGDREHDKQLTANARQLARIITDNPAYHRLHEVYYTLGLTHQALDRPYRAYRAFGKALAAKPAMNLAQPISRLHHSAWAKWIQTLSRWLAWSLLGVLMTLLAVICIRSKPWTWFRFRHLASGLAVILAWVVLFHLSHKWLAISDEAEWLINNDGAYPKPVYVHIRSGTPGSEVADYLFVYGLASVTGAFLFSVALGRMRRRIRAIVFNSVFTIAFTAALATLYYLDHCDGTGRFYASEPALAGLPNGYLAYPMKDPEPYLLINPLYYRGLELTSIDDPVLAAWLKSFINLPAPSH
jgi:tetratricopeptide (TPR) repeat protein